MKVRHTGLILDDTLGVCIELIGYPRIIFPVFQYDLTKPRAQSADIGNAIRLMWFDKRHENIKKPKIGTTLFYSYAEGWDNPNSYLSARESILRRYCIPVGG